MTGPEPSPVRRAQTRARRRPGLAVAISLGAHLALLPLLFLTPADPPAFSSTDDDFDAVILNLEPPPLPIPPPEPELAPEPAPDPKPETTPSAASPAPPAPPPAPPPPPLRTRAPRPVPANVETVVASVAPVVAFVGLGAEALGGATVAGAGSGEGSGTGSGDGAGTGSGGRCDMVRRLQDALRDDADIRRTAAEAQGSIGRDRALLLWDGDWLMTPGQAGRGLAGVRQAIAVEIAFSPPACRRQAMRGYALITLGDAPGSPRIALGAPNWRWSDLAGGR
ncbi:hypothetical protein [Brevundimonas sp.]|uniref:hypothetical protein n=1 Tax=Brevundimonas sp. TaxID=1871086 RepID=UPI00378428BD